MTPRKTQMALSDAALAGIVVGAILILTSIFGAILYGKRRHSYSASPQYASLSSPVAPESPTLSPPPLTSIKKRVHDDHGRYPSLENGPGPTFVTRPGRAIIPDHMTTTSLDAERRPNTAVSARPGSLHQAVLDIGDKEAQTAVAGAIEEENKKVKTEQASTEDGRDVKLRPKGYSGAWP